jgi:hypothetical protein
MSRSTMTNGVSYARFTQIVVGLAGVAYLLTGIALLFAPAWFFVAIGHFQPFNRHYEGDLGSFLLPLGIGLLVAARDPARNIWVIRVAAFGSLLHVLNHIYDALFYSSPPGAFLQIALLLILALLLIAVSLQGGTGWHHGADHGRGLHEQGELSRSGPLPGT